MLPHPPNSIREIMLPFSQEVSIEPSVTLNDPISTAIEVMIEHNLNAIAVLCNRRPVGQIRLRDAMTRIGIHIP